MDDDCFIYDPIKEEKVYMTGNSFIVGRDSSCDFVINDESISAKHAEIVFKGERYFIKDLNSSNFTYVNGHKVDADQYVVLQSSDTLIFGKKHFYFNSSKAHYDYIDLPSLTGTYLKDVKDMENGILRYHFEDAEENVLELKKEKKGHDLKALKSEIALKQKKLKAMEAKTESEDREGLIRLLDSTKRLEEELNTKEKVLSEKISDLEREFKKIKQKRDENQIIIKRVEDELNTAKQSEQLKREIESLRKRIVQLEFEKKLKAS